MRKLYSLFLIGLLSASVFAQAPQKMSYQAVIRNLSNQLVTTQVGMKISILQGSETGTVKYVEIQTPTPNENGLITIQIGDGDPGTFAAIDWSAGPYFIRTETAVAAPLTTYTITGTSQLLSVPYALFAKSSGNIPPGTAIGDLQYWNGTAWVILAPGATGKILTINSSNIPSWQYASEATFLAPTVTTQAATNVQGFSAKLNGVVNPNGSLTYADFEWGLTAAYGEDGNMEDDGEITGSSDVAVSVVIPNISWGEDILEPGTTYHYRIKANNSINSSYGSDMTFTTTLSAPFVKTSEISSITGTTAEGGGDIVHNGGANVTVRGVCWSTSTNPTIALSTKTEDGTGIGLFYSTLTGLSARTTYYVRAYATNSIGTSYGDELSFIAGIGSSYQGGIIAYIFRPGDPGYIAGQTHGLIAAPTDQSTGIQWYNGSYTSTGATGTSLGTGNANTNAIVTNQGAGSYAAKLCYDLSLNGYSDWYLPSKDELILILRNLVDQNLGDFETNGEYWSSSEYNNINFAWYNQIYSSQAGFNAKYNIHNVRAVRSF